MAVKVIIERDIFEKIIKAWIAENYNSETKNIVVALAGGRLKEVEVVLGNELPPERGGPHDL